MTTTTRDLVITRVFDAPRELVWRAWSSPEHFMRWWGPKDYTSPTCRMDFRTGGSYHWCMRTPDGIDMWTCGDFLEVSPMDRLVFTDSFADAEGNSVPPSQYGMPGDEPVSLKVTVLFEEILDGTKVTMTHENALDFEGAEEGWDQSFDKLADSLGKPFLLTRTFDAPRELVWKAFTEQERMAQWWGPPGSTVRQATMDFRPGGRYHFCSAFPDGTEIWGLFVFQEVSPTDRIVYLHSFSDETGHVAESPFGGPWAARIHTSLFFASEGQKTVFTLRQFPINATSGEEAAFAALSEGMSLGWDATFDKLDAYIAEVQV